MNTGTQRLAIMLGGLVALPCVLLGIYGILVSGMPFAQGIALSLGSGVIGFLIPFSLIHAIMWVVRGYRQED